MAKKITQEIKEKMGKKQHIIHINFRLSGILMGENEYGGKGQHFIMHIFQRGKIKINTTGK